MTHGSLKSARGRGSATGKREPHRCQPKNRSATAGRAAQPSGGEPEGRGYVGFLGTLDAPLSRQLRMHCPMQARLPAGLAPRRSEVAERRQPPATKSRSRKYGAVSKGHRNAPRRVSYLS